MAADEMHDRSMVVSDGRTVAWTECGSHSGTVVVRIPGTPGGRWSLRGDRAPWTERELHVITTERPGFGSSTRRPGRGFAEPARDLVEILDRLELDQVLLHATGGGAPHVLAFAARYPDRVRAVTIESGMAPLTDDDAATMRPVDVRGRRLARLGDLPGLQALLEPVRRTLMADPLAGFQSVMSQGGPADQEVMIDPLWQLATSRATREALGAGVEGWVDETIAVFGDWPDVDGHAIAASVTWWHGATDRDAPMAAAERLVAALPKATLRTLPLDGYFAAYRREAEILDELLGRY